MCVELAAHPMPQRKTIENLRKVIRDICGEWQIEYSQVRACVTDGGANIKGAVRAEFGADKHISCAGHMLNNIGEAVLKFEIRKPPSEQEPHEALLLDVPDDEDEAETVLDNTSHDTTFQGNDSKLHSRAFLCPVCHIYDNDFCNFILRYCVRSCTSHRSEENRAFLQKQ